MEENGSGSVNSGISNLHVLSVKQTWSVARMVGLILLYFTLSIGLTFYQRAIVKVYVL